ncbi:DUF1214 domain-containing protein [Paraburkholderia sp. BL23I1N1]|uniref:DUF1214 domain-containing protein n=1 Tax=Paraburkholderia sp. BL23I1N1 TaxID=1938802 RepID=UPI000E716C8D|nr:DUF1214 domain-containing protein [Paraburkholderia sp. BL23I1N1]
MCRNVHSDDFGERRHVYRHWHSGSVWSPVVVDKDGQFLAANPINRYQISSRTPGLVVNADGSVDIWLQAQRPVDTQAANWLPTPADGRHFTLFARAYEPTGGVLAGTFKMPPVELLP